MAIQKLEVYSNKGILINGLYILQPQIFSDSRGCFYEAYNQKSFSQLHLDFTFVQDNISVSSKNVLRGMHFQKKYCQGKLIQCLQGEIFDYVIDLRKGSTTFGQYAAVTLNENNKNSLYIPKGFAHGYLVLSESAMISYKCTDFYHPEDESGINWNDNTINISWPVKKNQLILKERDMLFPEYNASKAYFDIKGNWIGE